MKLAIATLSIINYALAALSFLPCMMAGLMSMDSPQAQNSVLSHVFCCLILGFPIVCLVCSGTKMNTTDNTQKEWWTWTIKKVNESWKDNSSCLHDNCSS